MKLTEEESIIIDLISQGENNFYIAAELECSPSTINRRLRKIYRKFGVSNKIELLIELNRRNLDEIRKDLEKILSLFGNFHVIQDYPCYSEQVFQYILGTRFSFKSVKRMSALIDILQRAVISKLGGNDE